MPSAPVLDFDRLLAPISDELPGGTELREDDEGARLFGDLQDAYRKARTDERERIEQETIRQAESAGESGTSVDPSLRSEIDDPDWHGVCEQAIEIIAAHSKDLWVAAWLTDALVRRDGVRGLRDGFRLIREVAGRFWDGVHPAPEDGSYETTTAQLRSLIGAPLVAAIRNLPLAIGAGCSFGDYRNAAKNNSEALGPILAAVEETPADFYGDLASDIEAASEELSLTCRFFMERCEDAAPNPSLVRSELEECLNNLRTVAPEKLAAASSESDEAESDQDVDAGGPSAQGRPPGLGGPITSREEAFAALRKIAEYFKKHEPTSPVPIVLEHAVRLGGKPFTELIEDLVSSQDSRLDVYRRIGAIVAPDEQEGE